MAVIIEIIVLTLEVAADALVLNEILISFCWNKSKNIKEKI